MEEVEKEIMAITQEECAEVIQAISKVFRFGIDNSHNGVTNRSHLTTEIGDLLAMITLCHDFGIVDYHEVMIAKDAKLEKLRTWSNIFK